MTRYSAGFMLALALLTRAVPAASQRVDTPQGVVEFVGLHRWTIQMVRDSMRVHAPGKPLGQCAAVLRSLGFASAQSLGMSSPDGVSSSLVIVVEPQDSMLVRYRKLPTRALPRISSWSPGYDILKNHLAAFQSGAQDFGVHAIRDTILEQLILQSHPKDSSELRSLWKFLESTRNSRDAALAERALLDDASVENRILAAAVLGAQRGRVRAWYALVKGLRDPDERVAAASELGLMSLMTGDQKRIDWRPVVSDLRAILDGTNVLALRTTLQMLTKTKIDPTLASALLREDGGLVIDFLRSHSPTHRDAAHEFLVWLAARDLGLEPDGWISWLRGIHARRSPVPGQVFTYDDLAGCYQLTVSEWSPPLGGDKGFHTIPTSIRLDTVPALRGGRVVAPDIHYPVGRSMRGLPRWEILGDTVRIVWSNGFSATNVRLTRKGNELNGWAEATSDAIPAGEPNWPRADILARRVACVE